MDAIGQEFLRAAAARFEQWKATAEKAIEQLDDEQLHWAPDAESNSAAVLLQHLAGNLRSRWRDFRNRGHTMRAWRSNSPPPTWPIPSRFSGN